MTKYILHGGYTSIDNELNHSFYLEITCDLPHNATILLCYFASGEDSIMRKFNEDCDRLIKQSQDKNLKFIKADEANFIEQLRTADALYIRGGSTQKLLDVLRKYDNLELEFKNKTIAGSSSGAYVLGKFSPFHNDEHGPYVREGLGLLPIRIVSHYKSDGIAPTPGALKLLEETNQDLDLVLLKDFEMKVFFV